jgi:TATA-box binding protein (TBP) (component of TFIID and TFIIIB)
MDYRISTITLNTFIEKQINLQDLGTFLKIDNDILGYKYKSNNNIVVKGVFVGSTSFFNNQLTLKLKHPKCDRIINVKVFNNGSFHFTGCTNVSDGKFLTEFLINKFNNVNCNIAVNLKNDANGISFDPKTNIIYNNLYKTFGQKLDNKYMINNQCFFYNKQRNIFISEKFTNKTKQVLDRNGKNIGFCKIIMLKGSRLYNNSNIDIDISTEQVKYKDIVIGNIVFYIKEQKTILNKEISIEYKMNFIDNYNITTKINCINACLKLNIIINRINLVRLLQESNYIVTYNPDIYYGVKLMYKQNEYQDGKCHCKTKCTCNTITFLIFESGNIIVTNFKEMNSIQKIINKFKEILIKY